jgi:hypothetical protein
VQVEPKQQEGVNFVDVVLEDAWVWDMYRPVRFVERVRVISFKDVNIEEISKPTS